MNELLEKYKQELEERIDAMQEERLPTNSVMGGILIGLQEARDLLLSLIEEE